MAIGAPIAIFAAGKEELAHNAASAESAYRAQSGALADAQEDTQQAQSTVSVLNAQSQIILDAMQTISAQMDEISQQIADLQQQIADKQTEIAAKQTEYDGHKASFKQRLSAMQELHDGGEIAFLSEATNIYEVLTFSEILQDISQKDKETLDELEAERLALETAQADLTADEETLQEKQTALEQQQTALTAKQKELADSLQQANSALSDAQAAEQAQQAVTAAAKQKWEDAVAAQDAYIKSQLASSSAPSIVCGLGFQCPLASYKYISTNFGDLDSTHSKPHAGTDFSAPAGTPILAAADGYVLVARGSSSYGNYVVLYHGEASDGHRYSTLYAHMTSYCVSAGQSVNRGDVIGYVGNTGHSYGNHLHLELWQGNTKINPLGYIPQA